MSFLDKLKTTVSEAGSKAKILVEQNKLKLANVAKQAQIEKLHKEIGAMVASLHFAGEDISVDAFQQQLEQISILKHEIEQNEHEIEMLSEEKECKQCGKETPVLAKVCLYCQAEFEIIDVSNKEQIEPILIEGNVKEQ